MARTVRAVQTVVAVLGLLLVAVVLGFVWYAHHRAQNYLAGLPKRLGIDIRQETDNVTYSQSYQGRTVFTVHAAKQIQHADGKYTLKDASVILYGRDAEGAGTMDLKRADKIRGSEFEYDQKNGLLTAAGDVYLDLAAPAGKHAAGTADAAADEARVVHIKTSGLTYLQKERTATTEKEIDFAASGMTGNALGATYNGATGVVLLHAAVAVNGVRAGRPVQLTASAAELDRASNTVRLSGAEYKTSSARDSRLGAESLLADHAVVNMQKDGTPQQLQAEGHVTLRQAGKGTLGGQRLEASFNDAGLMQGAHLAGAVRFESSAEAKQADGAADDLRVAFSPAGTPQHARMTGNVVLNQKSAAGRQTLGAQQLDVDFAGGGKQPVMLRAATAVGSRQGATLDDLNLPTRTQSHVEADTLVAHFAAANVVTGLDGHGHTSLTQTVSAAGGAVLRKDVSTGAELRLDLHAGANGRIELVHAEQRGDVIADRQAAAKKPGEPIQTEHVRAQDAVFDATANRVLLTGAVQLTDASSILLANAVTLDRAQDVATANGAVKVSYMQVAAGGNRSQAEPVHVQAAQAVMHKATGVAEFTTPGGTVRMWQGGSVIEAPVIDLDQTTKTVFAKDGVRAVLTGAPAAGASSKNGAAQPVRVQATTMKYADATRTIDLAGPVRVDDANGRLTANNAVLTLAAAAEKAAPALLGAGRVERVVATGNVDVVQPGRKASGERLVYTAADGVFLLTGTKALPPHVTDAARGTIAGTEIRFTRGEDSVVVTGGEGVRVRTETRVKQ